MLPKKTLSFKLWISEIVYRQSKYWHQSYSALACQEQGFPIKKTKILKRSGEQAILSLEHLLTLGMTHIMAILHSKWLLKKWRGLSFFFNYYLKRLWDAHFFHQWPDPAKQLFSILLDKAYFFMVHWSLPRAAGLRLHFKKFTSYMRGNDVLSDTYLIYLLSGVSKLEKYKQDTKGIAASQESITNGYALVARDWTYKTKGIF